MMIIDLENHKGSFCSHASIFCQEGYCSRCQIYLKMATPNKSISERVMAMLQEVATSNSRFLVNE
jgi:ferredoxin